MKHLLICGEYPPTPSGGIGTYGVNISRRLAEAGETVHVIARQWEGAETARIEELQGRLIVHRVPFEDWAALRTHRPHPAMQGRFERVLFNSDYPPQCFSWSAAAVAERLVEEEGIDVIEAQEYEAPLYYFQLRRALGWGPQRRPPCVVHLHSPSELIARHNGWDPGQPAVLTAKRLEDFSIAAADLLLCPSQFLARQSERHYGLELGAVITIPYLLGETSRVPRDGATWDSGVVSFVGRLEPRKGVFEWVNAAVQVASRCPEASFEFVGADTWIHGRSVRQMLQKSIPRSVRRQFTFCGEQPRAALPSLLTRARIGVVPSRWDNFPNACMELMASGLPVIATREGGMAEMIADGESGWLTRQPGADGLAEALARALATPPARLAEMGHRAEREISSLCANDRIIESQLEIRQKLVAKRADRSLRLPPVAPVGERKLRDRNSQCKLSNPSTRGGIAVLLLRQAGDLPNDQILSDLDRQLLQPCARVVATTDLVLGTDTSGKPCESKSRSLREAVESIVASNDPPLGVALVTAGIRLEPTFLSTMESALRSCPDVGVVSCWLAVERSSDRAWVRPSPGLPYQLLMNDAGPCPTFRTEALAEVLPALEASAPLDGWWLSNRVLAGGWLGTTAPALLARVNKRTPYLSRPVDAHVLQHVLNHWQNAGPNFDARPLRSAGGPPSMRQSLAAVLGCVAAARALASDPRLTAVKLWRRLYSKVVRRRNQSANSRGSARSATASPRV